MIDVSVNRGSACSLNLPVLVVRSVVHVCIHEMAGTVVREKFLHKNKQIIKQYKNKIKTRKKIKKDNDPVGYFGSSLAVHNPCKM